jgi:protein-arginine kinase activator protein McsA
LTPPEPFQGERIIPWIFKEKLDDKLANAAKGLKLIVPPAKVEFKIEVQFDAKIEKEALEDPLLRKEFEEAAMDTTECFVVRRRLKYNQT